MGLVTNIFTAIFLLAAANAASHQTYPGTSTRPILSDSEAATLSESKYLQGWSVESISLPSSPDYVVNPSGGTYTDIQAAVNAAINAGGTTRKYIQIKAGTYKQTVFIYGKVPLTIYGAGSSPSDVSIILSQAATLSVSDWIKQVNPGGTRYKSGDPAYSIYNQCASGSGTIGTTCTSIFWIDSDNVQVYNLQVTNSYGQSGDAQAVALKTDADKVHLSNVNLISRQDTLYAGSGKAGTTQRVYVENSYIEGDVDFVFGGASAVFSKTTFKAVSDRHPSSAVVFAPNTAPNNAYGFLVENSVITGDSTFKSTKVVKLARSWDANTASGAYVSGTSPNGELLIRNTQIDGVINVSAPYTTSTSSRTYSGDASTSRNLNNNNYNRFWEFSNTGDGA